MRTSKLSHVDPDLNIKHPVSGQISTESCCTIVTKCNDLEIKEKSDMRDKKNEVKHSCACFSHS